MPGASTRLNAVVTHFSYERASQCYNLIELMKSINSDLPSDAERYPFVILGDFNAYNDSSAPLELITSAEAIDAFGLAHKCMEAVEKEHLSLELLQKHKWSDAWREVNPAANETAGYTFSTMPWPGMVSRPDRILVSGATVSQVLIDRSSAAYKRAYYWQINLSRLSESGHSLSNLKSLLLLDAVYVALAVTLCLLPGSPKVRSRRRRLSAILLVGFVVVFAIAAAIFSSYLRELWSVAFHPQQEDYNPSDHLLLMADLQIPPR